MTRPTASCAVPIAHPGSTLKSRACRSPKPGVQSVSSGTGLSRQVCLCLQERPMRMYRSGESHPSCQGCGTGCEDDPGFPDPDEGHAHLVVRPALYCTAPPTGRSPADVPLHAPSTSQEPHPSSARGLPPAAASSILCSPSPDLSFHIITLIVLDNQESLE